MDFRTVKKGFKKEVIHSIDGGRNSSFVIARRFVALCLKISGGVILTVFLAPISLFRPIEIWILRSRRPKISLLIEDLEWGLRNLQMRRQGKKPIIIALYFLPFPNRQLAKMYRRILFLVGRRQIPLGKLLEFIRPIWGITKKNPIERYQAMFEAWNVGKPSIFFSEHEARLGTDLERRLFGGESPPFVCLAVQSHSYKKAIDVPATRYYGQLTDDPFTSISPIANYLPVIRYLTGCGIAVVRVGMMEDEELPPNLGSLVSDYAFDGRSEFGDVWLHSRCLFSLTGGAGSHWFAAAFNRPAVQADSYSLIPSLYDERSLFIPQRAWVKDENRFLTFSEIRNSEFGRDRNLIQSGVTIIKNTPEEIIDVTQEMICRLAGTWFEAKQDQELQLKYRKVVDGFPAHHRTPARMGAKFLREHRYLLPD